MHLYEPTIHLTFIYFLYETKLIAKLSWDLCCATDYEFQNILIPTEYGAVYELCLLALVFMADIHKTTAH